MALLIVIFMLVLFPAPCVLIAGDHRKTNSVDGVLVFDYVMYEIDANAHTSHTIFIFSHRALAASIR